MTAFEPQGMLKNAHMQTLSVSWPHGRAPRDFLRSARPFRHPVAEGELSGQLFWQPQEEPERVPLAVLIHGLGGDCQASYVTQTAHALWRRGYHVLALDLRGAGESARTAPYLYHAGFYHDLDEVVRAFAAAPRIESVQIAGFSMGGNVALKLAAAWGDAPPAGVRSLVSLAAPVDLAAAARNLSRWQAAMYRAHVLRGLVAQALRFRFARPERAKYRARALATVTQIAEYDAQVIVPHYGFASVEEYYTKASSGPDLGQISVPTLALHADDDPMVPGATVERALRAASAQLQLEITRHGGHLGWVEGASSAESAERWSTRRILEHFAQHRG